MRPAIIHDKEIIEGYLRENEALNVYCIGDLDDLFRPFTIWYGLRGENGKLCSLAMLYTGGEIPALMAYRAYEGEALAELVCGISKLLPARFYSHLCETSKAALAKRFKLESHGRHLKMHLKDPSKIVGKTDSGVRRLCMADLEKLLELYRKAYPGNWFDPATLATGEYFGAFAGGDIICAAGVHVFSEKYGAAALGNITTRPDYRGKGLAGMVTAALCGSLLKKTHLIGLNVDNGNAAAIRCYQKLGFAVVGEYDEFMAEIHPSIS
ncbi:MAG TPA: GNAT family N-acetyltransferase [Candidatus Wallbacteria bacterium]|nr:GNAT family N-acetyltransferase [Candidatus Wallbacteria bacterium]